MANTESTADQTVPQLSLAIRLAIAKERGFGKDVNAPVLGKLMLAERCQQDFYDRLAAEAMLAADGRVPLLAELDRCAAGFPESHYDDAESQGWAPSLVGVEIAKSRNRLPGGNIGLARP